MALKVFILEDDENFKRLAEIRLKAWQEDVAITWCNSLASARNTLEQIGTGNLANTSAEASADGEKSAQQGGAHFDLAVLDQHLPDGFGSEIAEHPALSKAAILAVSSDEAPELPGKAVIAGAQHFLAKRQVSEALFIPLIKALIERKRLELQLIAAQVRESRMESIKVLLATLRHEINNPLGAVLGAAYLFRTSGPLDPSQMEAVRLLESSSNRIKHVVDQLCETADLQEVTKAHEKVYQIPGDPQWEGNKDD